MYQRIHFLCCPMLSDAKDDLVLETAVNGGCDIIVSHNLRDFAPAQSLGVRAMTPSEFVQSHPLKEQRP